MKKRVAILTNIIAPYRIPCFNKLAELANFDVHVYFMAENESNRDWRIYKDKIRFEYKVLRGIHFSLKNERMIHLNVGLLFHLLKNRYDLIAIGGYTQPADWEALLLSKVLKTKLLLFGESTLKDKRLNNKFFEKMKRFFVKNCDGFLPAGNAAAEYMRYLGAPSDKIFTARFCADHDFLSNEYIRLRPYKEDMKKKRGYPPVVILYSGRFVWYKGISYLLEAFAELQRERYDLGLVLLGDGPEKEKYKKFCKDNNLKDVFFEGFIPQEKLPEYYISADLFVLPSLSDPWGLVVNEAMAFGLPIISTDAAGVTYDLVKNGINGFVVKAGDTDELYVALKKLCDSAELRRVMGRRSLEIIQDYTPEKWARAFVAAVETILGL